jgi:hypothetical protein
VEGFFRRARTISDARPPAPPSERAARASCVVCAQPVSSDQAIDRGRGIQHVVCEPEVISDLDRRIEAARALHRAFATLGAMKPLSARVESEQRVVGDVITPEAALEALARLRTAVELARFERPAQRKLCLTMLDGLLARVSGP